MTVSYTHLEPWKVALAAVLVEGIIFILLSFFKVRESIVNAIPANLKYGITAGIGSVSYTHLSEQQTLQVFVCYQKVQKCACLVIT